MATGCCCLVCTLNVQEPHNLTCVLNTPSSIHAALNISDRTPVYNGPYTITPSEIVQTFSTRGKKLTDDIVVQAIPNDYGKITWDGSSLRII